MIYYKIKSLFNYFIKTLGFIFLLLILIFFFLNNASTSLRKEFLSDQVINQLKAKGYKIVSLEITDNSTPIHNCQFSKKQPIALVIGDENFGVSEPILALSDTIIHIDMFGQNSSMNVVQATNIALYEITKQLR